MNNVYIYIVKSVFFSTGAFSGFLTKFVYKIDNVNKIMGINPDSLNKRTRRLPGIKTIVEILKLDLGLSIVVKDIPENFEELIKRGPITIPVSDETFKLFKNKLK